MLVAGAKETWELHSVRSEARPILEAALQSQSAEAQQTANKCINALGEMGIHDFRDLLGI
jgi:hypothetical protein